VKKKRPQYLNKNHRNQLPHHQSSILPLPVKMKFLIVLTFVLFAELCNAEGESMAGIYL
jgi:hypothetical protein